MSFTYARSGHKCIQITAHCCGGVARLIEEVCSFVRNRIVSDEPISKYQMVQTLLADSLSELWSARLMVCVTVGTDSQKKNARSLQAKRLMAKRYAFEMVFLCCRSCGSDPWQGQIIENKCSKTFLSEGER